jgi:hypothetical protein
MTTMACDIGRALNTISANGGRLTAPLSRREGNPLTALHG